MSSKKPSSKPTIILLILPIIGIYCLYLGIHDFYYLYVTAKDYPTIEATCKNIKVSTSDDGTTYTCEYIYIINNKPYSKISSLSTSKKPEINSNKFLKYNPSNPEEAIFLNDAERPFLITFGCLFTLIPLIIILNNYLNTKKKAFNILLGLTFTIISNKLNILIQLIESLIAYIIVLGICIATHAYFFFIPILVLLSLIIIEKTLNILYLKFLNNKPEIAKKINNIAKLLNLKGIIFYFWSSIIFGIFFTYKNNNPITTNIILFTIGLILFLIGIFIEFKRRPTMNSQ